MEIAQLIVNYVKVQIIISCSNPYIFDKRDRWLKYGRWTHIGRAKIKGHIEMHTYNP